MNVICHYYKLAYLKCIIYKYTYPTHLILPDLTIVHITNQLTDCLSIWSRVMRS